MRSGLGWVGYRYQTSTPRATLACTKRTGAKRCLQHRGDQDARAEMERHKPLIDRLQITLALVSAVTPDVRGEPRASRRP